MRRWKELLLVLASAGVALAVSESAVRVLAHRFAVLERDRVLGWRVVANRVRVRGVPGWGAVRKQTHWQGFVRVGDWRRRAPRILFVGDSYTQADNTPSGFAYYDDIARLMPEVEVFAYGGGGYGTMQELLILEKYFDTIHPDIVVLQFCSNDMINNDYVLDRGSFPRNNLIRRPYWEHGSVVYHFPGPWYGRFAIFDLIRLALVHTKPAAPDTASIWRIPEKDYRRTVAVTTQLLSAFRQRARPSQVVLFSSDAPPWLRPILSQMTRSAGIPYVSGVPEDVEAAAARGERVYISASADHHWSAPGHKIVAADLASVLRPMLP